MSYESEKTRMENLDGIPWFQAPLPSRWHRCTVQTRGWIATGPVERCACGAIRRHSGESWLERNSRRKDER